MYPWTLRIVCSWFLRIINLETAASPFTTRNNKNVSICLEIKLNQMCFKNIGGNLVLVVQSWTHTY